jgi:hypothetical protein
MAEPNPFAKYAPSAPSGGGTFVAGPGAAEEAARKARDEQRAAEDAAREARREGRDVEASGRNLIGDYRKEFLGNDEVKDFRKVTNATRQIVTLMQGEGSPMGDLGGIFTFMKSLDPTSVVREGEQASVQNAAGIPENVRNYYNRLATGKRLSPEQRADMVNTALNLYGSRAQSYNTFANTYRGLVADAGGDPDKQGITLAPSLAPAKAVISEAGAKPGQLVPATTGAAQLTDEDRAAQSEMQAAYNAGISAGKTPEQIIQEVAAIGQRYGRQIDPSYLDLVRKSAEQRGPMQFIATPTGETGAAQGLLGELLKTEAGQTAAGYFGSAANALTAGYGMAPETKEYLRETAPVSSFVGELTGGAMATIPAVRGAQGILAGTRLAGAAPLIGETLYGALYGSGEAGEGNRLQGAAIGGLGALGAGALANRFLPGGPGTFTGAPRTNVPSTGRFSGQQISPEQIIAAGRQADIPVMTSDAMPPTTRLAKFTQSAGEVMPLGTAGTRREQQVARQNAVENLLADYGVSVDSNLASEVVSNLNQTRADTISRYTDMKQNVIQQFAGRGSLPGGNVPATKSTAAIDGLLSDLRAENLPQQLGPLARQLEDIRNSLTTPGDLSKIEANRKTLFDLKADPNLASISSKSEKAFQKVYTALNEDMGDYIKANGTAKDFNLWKVANTKLARTADELRVGGLKNVLNKGEFDPTLVTKMLTSSKPADVRTLFTSLNKDGRESARLLLIQDAAKRAMNKETGDVDPNKFAREVMGLSDNFSQFFGASDMRRVKGLAEVLRATRRAQEAAFQPRTGEQLVPLATMSGFGGLGTVLGSMLGQGAGVSAGVGLATSAAFGAAKRLYESPPARDLLLRISQASGSKKAELINQFLAGASATAGAAGATRMSEGE